MFHTGSLQDGISLAIQQRKLVACFIRQDDDHWSRIWEEYYLKYKVGPGETTAGESIASKAVLLRLDHGSKEASFLNAFCPIIKPPTLVIIDNGKVLEKLEGGLEMQDWWKRIANAIGVEAGQPGEPKDTEESTGTTESSNTPDTTANVDPTPAQPSSSTAAPAQPPTPSTQTTTPISSLFPTRAQTHDLEHRKRTEAAAAEKAARTAARKREAEEAHAAHNPPDSALDKVNARRDWMVQQTARNDDLKRERARILAQIEADKADRKARFQREKDDAEGASSPLRESTVAAMRRTAGAGGRCDLAVRLFDGRSIKGRFDPGATLGGTVREWISEETGEGRSSPYTFRQIMAPRPSRSIEVAEEQLTLAELEMVPTATLVLVPVTGSTADVYGSSGVGGVFGAVYQMLYRALLWLWAMLSSILPSSRPQRPTSDAEPSEADETRTSGTDASSRTHGSSARVKVRSLADQRAEALKKDDPKTEFYNGNSLGTEPRKDDDDQKKK